jgi:hypothetical protein
MIPPSTLTPENFQGSHKQKSFVCAVEFFCMASQGQEKLERVCEFLKVGKGARKFFQGHRKKKAEKFF